MRICRFTAGDDPRFGLVDGAGEKIAEISGDPLYTPTKRVKTETDANEALLLSAGEELRSAIEAQTEPVHVALVHDGFTERSATWRSVEDSWEQLLDGLVDLFDDGE